MASTQDDATPVKEVTEESAHEYPITEEKAPTSEETEVAAQEEEEEGEEKSGSGGKITGLSEDDAEETFVQSPIIGEEEPGATFDREGEAKAETEEEDEDII